MYYPIPIKLYIWVSFKSIWEKEWRIVSDNSGLAFRLKIVQRKPSNAIRSSNTQKKNMIVYMWLDNLKLSPNESNSESNKIVFVIYIQRVKVSTNSKIRRGLRFVL